MWAVLRKLLAIGAQGRRDLIRAQFALLRAHWRLRRRSVGGLVTRRGHDAEPITGDPARARALARAVERAATHGVFRPLCLTRAIALREVLDAEGITGSDVRVGVRRVGGRFDAHAWVRWGDAVLGDRPEHVAEFTEVDDIRVLDRS